MTPNIASVISSASNANGSASAFLFAAASEPEAAFSVPFPEAYARRTTTERQSQTIHIDPRPRAPLSHPPTRSPLPRLATRVSSHSNSRRPARARARSRRFLTFVVFLPRVAAHTSTRHDHTSSVSAHIPLPPTHRARASLIIHPQRPPRPIASAVASPRASRVTVRARRYRGPARRVHTARTCTRTVPRTRARDRRLTLRRARHDSSSRRDVVECGRVVPLNPTRRASTLALVWFICVRIKDDGVVYNDGVREEHAWGGGMGRGDES